MNTEHLLQLEYEAFIDLVKKAGLDPYQSHWPEHDHVFIRLLTQLEKVDALLVKCYLEQGASSPIWQQLKLSQARLREKIIDFLKKGKLNSNNRGI